MKTFTIASFVAATLASSTSAQTAVCTSDEFAMINAWMASCDVVVGTAAKCADRTCHVALHRLEEEETHQCWEAYGGSHDAFAKYEAIDAFCHGEGPDPELPVATTTNSTAAPGQICSPEDGLAIYGWMYACDSVEGDAAAKCANNDCHAALHRLEEEETHACWEFLGLGTHEDFDKYVELDALCHGEDHGSDHDHDDDHDHGHDHQ